MPLERKSDTTLRDIAQACGVSHTTVSFVLRGRKMGISEKTRQHILEQAIALDYKTRPDQRIDSQKIRVLFLLPSYGTIYSGDHYYTRLLAQLCEQAEATGIQIMIQGSSNRDIIQSLYRGICQDRVDVVLTITLATEELDHVLKLSPVPVACTDLWANPRCSRIGYDSEWVGREAARQFHLAGHRKLAVLCQGDEYASPRVCAFLEEARELGCSVENVQVPSKSEMIIPSLQNITKPTAFTALFCPNDTVALVVMQAFHDKGIRVPEDVSIIGCDDHAFSSYSHPALSTFRMDEKQHAAQLLDAIQQLVAGACGSIYIENKATFIQRQSVRSL